MREMYFFIELGWVTLQSTGYAAGSDTSSMQKVIMNLYILKPQDLRQKRTRQSLYIIFRDKVQMTIKAEKEGWQRAV